MTMRAVWSLWSKPMDGAYGGGWPSLRDHLLSWVLSVQTCRRFFDSVHLVADSRAAALLVDQLRLAFDSVSLSLDQLETTDAELWALGKLWAYREQHAPFLHIDSDVYLWKPPRGEPAAADAYSTYPEWREYGQSFYRCASLKADVHRVSGWLPEELDSYVPSGGMLRAENCAVVGGTRTDFIRYYAEQAIRTIDDPAQPASLAPSRLDEARHADLRAAHAGERAPVPRGPARLAVPRREDGAHVRKRVGLRARWRERGLHPLDFALQGRRGAAGAAGGAGAAGLSGLLRAGLRDRPR